MFILGVSGSHRPDEISGVCKLVNVVLEATGCDYELISLRGKTIGGCIACLGCAGDNVCRLKDDFIPLRQKIVDADAFVIGSPNYYSCLNAATHAFLERWFQFRHREGDLLWGKLGVAVGVGGVTGRQPADEIEKFFLYNLVETVAKVSGRGAASCYSCGYGETCKVGLPCLLHGEGVRITDEIIPDVTGQPDVMRAAAEAGRLLGRRLREGYNRREVARRMQEQLMGKLKESV